MGATVLASVRSEAAAERLRAWGAEPVAPDAVGERAAALGGVDVVLELVGAPNLATDLRAIAARGRIMIVGTGAGAETEISLRALMGKRASIAGTVLRARPLDEKAAAVRAFERAVLPLLASGRLEPVVDRVFPADRAVQAFDHLAAPGKLGKVLLRFDA
jgi:NADPH:quinone reductase-like Zn-dependent oxidoreductase